MKVAALILTMFLAAVSAAGQVLTVKNDIPESQYLAAAAKAAELLKTANYRSVWTREYWGNASKAALLQEKVLVEFVQRNKWRTVEEDFYDNPIRTEKIQDGKWFYLRTDDQPWEKSVRGGGVGIGNGPRPVKNQLRFLPGINFEGQKADFYEMLSDRMTSSFCGVYDGSARNLRTTRVWYSAEGKILKKTEEITTAGREEMLRETTTYEYHPKDLKIEAPVIK